MKLHELAWSYMKLHEVTWSKKWNYLKLNEINNVKYMSKMNKTCIRMTENGENKYEIS